MPAHCEVLLSLSRDGTASVRHFPCEIARFAGIDDAVAAPIERATEARGTPNLESRARSFVYGRAPNQPEGLSSTSESRTPRSRRKGTIPEPLAVTRSS
jgi:hypothetical protein